MVGPRLPSFARPVRAEEEGSVAMRLIDDVIVTLIVLAGVVMAFGFIAANP